MMFKILMSFRKKTWYMHELHYRHIWFESNIDVTMDIQIFLKYQMYLKHICEEVLYNEALVHGETTETITNCG